MENLIAIALFVLTGILLLKDYKIIIEQKKRVLSYISLVVLASLFIVTLFCTTKFDSFNISTLYLLIAIIVACVFFISILILIRMLWKPNIWYICLFVPIGVIFSIFLIRFNAPVYTGAMDGFAAVTRFITEILVVCFIYPLCIFSYKMLKINRIIKSVLIISISVISFVCGITLSIGVNGYLSDESGGWFLFFCIWLIIIGVFPLIWRKFSQAQPVPDKTK